MSHEPSVSPQREVDQADEQLGQEQRVEDARRYAEQLTTFHVHVGVFLASMALIFVVNLMTNFSAGIAGDWRAYWSAWALVGWGLGIAVHGLVVRLNRPTTSSSSWEHKQMQKVLNR